MLHDWWDSDQHAPLIEKASCLCGWKEWYEMIPGLTVERKGNGPWIASEGQDHKTLMHEVGVIPVSRLAYSLQLHACDSIMACALPGTCAPWVLVLSGYLCSLGT